MERPFDVARFPFKTNPLGYDKETIMADKDSIDRVANPARVHADADAGLESAGVQAQWTRGRPARPDPETGEVPAGPGDAGLLDRPQRNAGSPGTRQMSNMRLGIGVGIAALLTIFVVVVAALF